MGARCGVCGVLVRFRVGGYGDERVACARVPTGSSGVDGDDHERVQCDGEYDAWWCQAGVSDVSGRFVRDVQVDFNERNKRCCREAVELSVVIYTRGQCPAWGDKCVF